MEQLAERVGLFRLRGTMQLYAARFVSISLRATVAFKRMALGQRRPDMVDNLLIS